MQDIFTNINWLDVLIAIPIIIAIAKGVWRGFIMEAASFVGLFLGIIGGFLFLDQIKSLLQNFLEIGEGAITILAFIVIFFSIIIGVSLLAKLASYIFEIAQLGIVNRIIGGVFGLISSFLIVGLLIMLLNKVDDTFSILSKEVKNESVLYSPISAVMPKIFDILGLEQIEELLHPKTLTEDILK